MSAGIAIAGYASRLGRPLGGPLEASVRSVVSEALDASALALADIDTVVTVASDTLDGVMVPIRAEVAGSFGRSYLNVPSSAGHAIGAASALLESGQAETVLLAGWGSASRLADHDCRQIQADPFYNRPSGASPAALAALQAQELKLDEGADGAESSDGVTFCDGVVTLILQRTDTGDARLRITDFGQASRGYMPEDGEIDPVLWVTEALANCRDTAGRLATAQAAGPSGVCEARALSVLDLDEKAQPDRQRGGAANWFGPATGLYQLVGLCRQLSTLRGENAAALLDLAGPLGQHVTLVRLSGVGGARA